MDLDLANAILAWLVASGGKSVTRRFRSDPTQQALRVVVTAAVHEVTDDLVDIDESQRRHVAWVLLEGAASAGTVMVRSERDLRIALSDWMARLDQPLFGGDRYVTDLGLDPAELASNLAEAILHGIRDAAASGGPLGPIAGWLWRDGISRRLDRIEHAVTTRTTPPPTTKPWRDWSPFELDVRGALPPPAAAAAVVVHDLPGYVHRHHDAEVDAALADISNNVMVVLTGNSGTGKTRALYEAVGRHSALREWPLCYPRGPEQIWQLAQQEPFGPMVLWLNDLHRVFTEDTADRCAAALSDLLRRDGGPTVILATEWPSQWREWAALRGDGEDCYPNLRPLLTERAVHRSVPDKVNEELRQELLDSDDPRLVAAARNDDGRVFQRVAGGPQLTRWYDHSWIPAVDTDGGPRDGAQMAELTGLVPDDGYPWL